MRKLTDVSYVVCSGNPEAPNRELIMQAGFTCQQGIVGQKIDSVAGPSVTPSTTRTYDLQTYGATAAPTATA